jgi:3-dehydroquinate synthase
MLTEAAARPRTIAVDLAGRPYDIIVGRGLLAGAGQRIAALKARRVAIVTDRNVAAAHLSTIERSALAADLAVSPIVVEPGEPSKSFATLAEVSDALLAARVERGDLVLALGGGVVGDLAGFAAAILRRGVRLVQVPTSLLAQVDSSVGGKTGINTGRGKNLIGAFHQPSLVIIDVDVLKSLPAREFRAGYAEMAKYGLIDDADFFARLERSTNEIFAQGPALDEAIAKSCAAKAALVMRDEFETGDRALLNLGHTFAHALETAVGYDGSRLVHGEAVAIGMVLAFRFSAFLGLAPEADAARVAAHLASVGLPTRIGDISGEVAGPEKLVEMMAQDKKVVGGALTFILAHGIGKSFIARDVPAAKARAFLESLAAA